MIKKLNRHCSAFSPMLRLAILSQAFSSSLSLKQYFVPDGPWVPPTQ